MTVPNVQQKVQSILVEMLGIDEAEVTPTAMIENDLGADSLDLVEIVMTSEEEFGIEIPDADAEKVKTVGEMVTYIEGRLAAKTARL